MREKAEKALASLKAQRDGLVAQIGKVDAAISVVEFLLKPDAPAEPAEPKEPTTAN